MDWKRRLEIICGLVTAVLGIIIMLGALAETQMIARRLQEPARFGNALAVSFALYGLPAFLVAIGAYGHATKRQQWARFVLIAASLFLLVWLFFSFAVLVWSKWSLPICLLTGFAILTSIISLIVRRER